MSESLNSARLAPYVVAQSLRRTPHDLLAVRNPAATLDKFRHEVRDATTHWQGEVARAGKVGSGALLSASTTILKGLVEIRTWNRNSRRLTDPDSKDSAEIARRKVLSALGMSALLRAAWGDESDAVPNFIGPDGEVGNILDIVFDERIDPAEPSDSRLHVPIAIVGALPEGTAEQWFRQDNLWMRQVRPAEPTEYLTTVFLPKLGLEPDFDQFETIYPYIATK